MDFMERYGKLSVGEFYSAYGHPQTGFVQQIPEFAALLNIYKALEPKRVIEVGTQYGGTLFYWLKYLAQGEGFNGVISIDVDHTPMFSALPKWDSLRNRLYTITGDSTDQELVDKVEILLDGEKVDFLFIDGCHYHPYPMHDFSTYRGFVRDGGVIAFHDIKGSPEGDGPKLLWDEIKESGAYKTDEFCVPGVEHFGIGVIYVED